MQVHRVEVVRRVPHAGRGFTQGLIVEPPGTVPGASTVLESTGLYGQSQLRRYRIGTDSYKASATLSADFFGEGICQVGDSVWQLTWRERRALRWDAKTLEIRDIVSYNREGWGICALPSAIVPGGAVRGAADGDVVTSDGTSELVRRDPQTLQPREVIKVRCQGARVRGLNDLAWSGDRVWANVAPTTTIAGIDLATGEVTDLVDASAAAEPRRGDPQAIMNGIAALPRGRDVSTETEFLVTGKGWRWIRQVRLAPARGRVAPDRLLEGAGRFFY
jgi:glutamine cyclotransferase